MEIIDKLLGWATTVSAFVVVGAIGLIFSGFGSSPREPGGDGDKEGFDPRYPRDHPRNRRP